MKTQKYSTWLALPFITLLWAGAANAMSVGGQTVDAIGSDSQVGSGSGEIEYYIPLGSAGLPSSGPAPGTYGVTGVPCGTAGLCQDGGSGAGYLGANALVMNFYFDLSGEPDSASATLKFVFDDLDLRDVNDPTGFVESMSLSYWDETGSTSTLDSIGGVYQTTAELGAQGLVTSGGLDDAIEWSIDLGIGGLNLLSLLNNADEGFWIQLGFGSEYRYPNDPRYGDWANELRNGRNTSEFLTAELNLSPVPLPSAVWLFGSALLGFIGMSRRTRV